MRITTYLLAAALSAGPLHAHISQAQVKQKTHNPKELGVVRWGSRLEPALESSAKDRKPVLLLFQEVPG